MLLVVGVTVLNAASEQCWGALTYAVWWGWRSRLPMWHSHLHQRGLWSIIQS